MSKRKDLRNDRESSAWKPHRWSPHKCMAFTGHALTAILLEFEREMSRQEATRVFGDFLRERQERINDEFKRRWASKHGAA